MGILIIATIITILFGTLLFWIYRRLTRNYSYWDGQGVKTVKPWIVLGSTYEYFRRPADEVEDERYKKYGRIYGTYEFTTRALCIAEPELIKDVLVKDFNVFTNRRAMDVEIPVVGSGLSFSRGEQWKRIRAVLSPSFTSGKMRKMNPLIAEATDGLLQNFIVAADDKKLVDLKKYFSSFSMDVIGLTAFGIRVDSLKNPDHPFVVNARRILSRDTSPIIFILFVLCGILRFFSTWALRKMGLLYFCDICQEIIEARTTCTDSVKQIDLMQLMLDAREGKLDKDDKEKIQAFQAGDKSETLTSWNKHKVLSDEEIKAQGIIFFLIGHDTTATALTFLVYDLALNPEVQERLHREVRDTYQQHEEFNYDVVKNMDYLEAVISESLRMHTGSFRLERGASEDYTLGSTGIQIPKGGMVLILTHCLHHDPEWFPDPYKFNPDRFLPENRSSIVPYTYLPFGEGPRSCIAMRFALLQIKICLATLLMKIKFVATEETRRKIEYFSNMTLLMPKAIHVGVERRN